MQPINEIAEFLQIQVVPIYAFFEQNLPTIRTMPETMSTALPDSGSFRVAHCGLIGSGEVDCLQPQIFMVAPTA